MDGLLQDLRHAARQVARTPVLTLMIAAVLAVGIGANTALLTVLDALLLRPPPGVRGGEGLVHLGMIRATAAGDRAYGRRLSYPEFLEFQRQRDVFSRLAVERAALVAVRDAERGTAPRRAVFVSSEYFAVLQPRLVLGTGFAPEPDENPEPLAQAVLSHAFWTRELGGAEDVVGRSLDINGVDVTVIGVAADRFIGIAVPEEGTDLWLPVSLQRVLFPSAGGLLAAVDSTEFAAFGRLAPGLPLESANAAAGTIANRVEAMHAGREPRYAQLDAEVLALRAFSGSAERILATIGLGGGLLAGLLLLTACANAGNLLLARAVMRRQEIGLKLALGASRGRVVRQLLAESLLVALLAGALGALLFVWLRSTLENVFSFTIDLSPRPGVFAITALLALATGVGFGIVPALHATRASVSDTLKTRSTGLDPRRSRLLQGFVVAQLTLGLPLLLASALFAAATRSMDRADLGFTAGRDALGVEIDFRLPGYSVEQADAVIDALRTRVASLQGVRAVAFATDVPLFGGAWSFVLRLPPEETSGAAVRFARVAGVDPAYFETMGIAIMRGRGITAEDVRGAPMVAVVGEDFARAAWPNLDPIGRTLHTVLDTTRTVVEVTVVGVVRTVLSSPLGSSDVPVAYMPLRQLPARPGGVLVLRASGGDAAGLASAARALITQVDPRLPVAGMRTFEQARRVSLREYLPVVAVTRAAAILALALGCLGVYALVAFNVAQRAREVAIRMALGARAADVSTLFLRQGTMLAVYGLALGLPLGIGIRLALTNLLGGVGFSMGTVAALGGVTVTLLLVSAAGSFLPARRAARVDPFRLLRMD